MIYSTTIALGFVRLCLLVLVLFYLNRKFVNYHKPENIFDFIANQWFKYGSLLTILLFVLVQLGIYNLFNTLLFLIVVIFIDYVGLRLLGRSLKFGSNKIKEKTFELIKNVELQKNWGFYVSTKTDKKVRGKRLWLLALLVLLGYVTFFSRFYFTKFDLYALSDLWILDLRNVVEFDMQHWFYNGVMPVGELALINFYSKISDISPELALESMGIIESVLIGILIFWVIGKITKSKLIAPIVACLFFALCYVLSPINISYILQHKSMFMALSLALPGMVFYLNPTLYKGNKKNYFFNFIYAFIAIGLIDLFTLLIIVMPFMLFGFIFSNRKHNSLNFKVLKAFLLSLILLFLIYGVACYFLNNEFIVFLKSSLIAASSYTYFPHLILPYDTIMSYYTIASLVMILILIIMTYAFKENWRESFNFLLLFLVLIQLGYSSASLIDTENVKQAIAVFIPLFFGIVTGFIVRILFPLYKKIIFIKPYIAVLTVAVLTYVAYYFQNHEFYKLKQVDSTNRAVLYAYENITNKYFPFSYAVVNNSNTEVISTNQHFFINYDEFLEEYLQKDYLFFKHLKDKEYFKKNPQMVLPNSVFVFHYHKQNSTTELNQTDKDIQKEVELQLEVLRQRGRKLEVVYTNKIFTIYEIVNRPAESKISDLIFKL